MKKINQIFAIALLIGLIASCKKEEIFTYKVNDSIYFGFLSGGQPLDTTAVTFAYSPLSVIDSTYKIPLKVTGLASDKDRSYSIVIDTGTTAVSGKHFSLPTTFTFRAGRLIDTLSIKLVRTTDMQTNFFILRIKLMPTSDLQTDLKSVSTSLSSAAINANSLKINISDILGPGAYWTSVYATYFGPFSAKKLRLINQITGMPLNYATIVGLSDLNLSARASFYAITMARYLSDQKAAGNTIYEADGTTLMTMGATYQ